MVDHIMIKKLMIVVGLVIVGMVFIGSPIETSDTPSTIAKKAGDSYKMNVIQDTTKKVTQDLGDRAIEQGCKDPNSQMCWTNQWVVFVTTLALAILFAGLAVGAIIGVIKIIASVFQ